MNLTTPAHYAALATLVIDWRTDVRALLGLFCVEVAGQVRELPMTHEFQPVPGVPGVEMAALESTQWPKGADPMADYYLLRGPGGAHSPDVLRVPQAVRLEILQGHQRYWKESCPRYVDYHPGDVFTCGAGEGHQWETLGPFRNRVSFNPALIPRS